MSLHLNLVSFELPRQDGSNEWSQHRLNGELWKIIPKLPLLTLVLPGELADLFQEF